MKRLQGIVAAVFLSIICVPAVQATDLTFYVGGINPGDLRSAPIRLPLDGGVILGGRISTSFIPVLGIEHTFGYSPDFLVPSNRPEMKDAKGFLYNTNLVLNIPLRKLTPYATAGVGFIWQYGAEDPPVGVKLAFNYGGGLKWRLFGPAGIRLDARGYTTTKVQDNSLNMFEMSAGFFVSF